MNFAQSCKIIVCFTPLFQNCKIYLCGTKLDLVKKDKRVREVDYHTTTDYADGKKRQFAV